ncbi:MAG TPA: hypothetical protein VMY98_10260 [Anaerolineae bacterium]|nr:hypothetical protein [Anaerolineae bacterium]
MEHEATSGPTPREVMEEMERKRAALELRALELRRMRSLKEARSRLPRDLGPVPELEGRPRPPAIRRNDMGEWGGFEAHKREIRALRKAEARARARRVQEARLARDRQSWLRDLCRGSYVHPEGVAEVLLWAVGL